MRAGIVVIVTRGDRRRLEAIIADRSAPQKHVWRANIILATADGCGTTQVMRRSGKSKPVVWRWQARFMAEGVDGLLRDKTRKPGKPPLSSDTVQRVSIWCLVRRPEKRPTGPVGCWRRQRG
jgi:transposase